MHGDGIALVFARTETSMFRDFVFPYAHGLLFLTGRPKFHRPDGIRAKGGCGGPMVLIAYGERNLTALRESGIAGTVVTTVKLAA